MADTRTLDVVINGKDNLSKALKDAEGASASFASKAGSAFGSVVEAAAKVTAAVAGIALGLGAIAEKEAIAFDKSMRNVDSIAKLSSTSFSQLETTVLALSKTLPQSADELARGLYDIYSSGFDGQVALDVLKESATGASAGLSTTAVSARALMAAMNAYNMKTGPDATHIMDVMFQTVNRGVLTFDELAQNIGDTIAISAIAKVPIEQVGAAFTVLTKHGINAAETSTALATFMRELIKPSVKAKALAESLGLEWSIAALKAKGLTGVLADMIEKTHGNEEQIATLTGNARGIKAAFILAAQGGQEFNHELEYMTSAAGATQAALDRQAKGTAYQFTILKNTINAFGIAIATETLPAINAFIAKVQEFVTVQGPKFQAFMSKAREDVYLLAAAVKLAFFGAFYAAIDVVEYFWNVYGDKFTEGGERLRAWALDVWMRMRILWTEVFATVQQFWTAHRDQLVAAVNTVVQFAAQVRDAFTILWFDLRFAALKFWNAYGDNISEFGARIWEFTKRTAIQLAELWDNVKGPLGSLLDRLGQLLGPLMELGGTVLSIATSAFSNFITVALEGLKVVLPPVIGFLSTLVGWISQAVDWLRRFIQPLDEALRKVAELTGSNLDTAKLSKERVITGINNGAISKAQFSSLVSSGSIDEDTRTTVLQLIKQKKLAFKASTGGMVPGMGYMDSVPALLTPGERVLTRQEARDYDRGSTGVVVNISGPFYGSDRAFADKLAEMILGRLKPAIAYAR